MKFNPLVPVLLAAIVAIAFTQKSYSVEQITTQIIPIKNTCKIAVTETITFNFVGSYSQVGRPILDANGYKSASVDSSSINVASLTTGVSVIGRPSTTRNKENDATFILFSFNGPSIGGLFQFKLTYTVDGPMSNDGGDNGGMDSFYWSYKFNVPINAVDFVYNPTFQVVNPNDWLVTPAGDVTQRTVNSVRVQRASISGNIGYDLTIKYPHSVSDANSCQAPKSSPLGTLLTIIFVSIFVGLFICCAIICSIWGAIRRGLLFGSRFGYAPSYGYTSTYYEPSHSYHTSHHHHHHSSGGHSSSSGISGTSGFAN